MGLFLIGLLGSSCSLLPHMYLEVRTDTWEEVAIEDSGVTVQMPSDERRDFKKVVMSSPGHVHGDVGMYLFKIVPHSWMEPTGVVDISVAYSREWEAPAPLAQGVFQVNKCYYPDRDELVWEFDARTEDGLYIWARGVAWAVTRLGWVYHQHDPMVFEKSDRLFRRIVCSIRYQGERVLPVEDPQALPIRNIVKGKPGDCEDGIIGMMFRGAVQDVIYEDSPPQ